MRVWHKIIYSFLLAAGLMAMSLNAMSQEWFVPVMKALEGLTAKQAMWTPSDSSHSVGQLAYHTGQILYIRKQAGNWDSGKGVK